MSIFKSEILTQHILISIFSKTAFIYSSLIKLYSIYLIYLIRFGYYFIQNRAREFATGYPNYGDPINNIIVTKFTKQNDITKLIKMCQCNKTANNS